MRGDQVWKSKMSPVPVRVRTVTGLLMSEGESGWA